MTVRRRGQQNKRRQRESSTDHVDDREKWGGGGGEIKEVRRALVTQVENTKCQGKQRMERSLHPESCVSLSG